MVKKLAAGAALFLLTLGATLVARTPLASLQSQMPALLQDTERFGGSLLEGSVSDLGTVNGPVDLSWQLDLLTLLGGKLGGQVEFDWLQASGNGEMALGLDRRAHLRDTIATAPAKLLETFLPFVRFDGDLRLQLDQGVAGAEDVGPFTGELSWKGSAVSLQERVALGDLTLALSERDGATHGQLSSRGGDLDLSGTVELQPSGEFAVDLRARPLSSASNLVRRSLGQIAEPTNDGSFRLRQSGHINEFM